MDIRILDWIQNTFKSDVLDKIFVFITSLGNYGAIWIAIAIILFINRKTRKYGLVLGVTLLLCLLIGNVAIKNIVCRPRPFSINEGINLLISAPLDYSFPSGHTMSSIAAATIIYYMNKKIGCIVYIIAFLIAFSRMYLYVHYFTDVLVGGILGFVIAKISIRIFKNYEN